MTNGGAKSLGASSRLLQLTGLSGIALLRPEVGSD